MKKIRLSKETKQNLLGLKVSNVGDDYIELEGGIKVYIDEAEIEVLGAESLTTYKFARKCDATGEGINKGYVVTDGLLYFKHKEDAIAHLKTIQMEGSEGLKGEALLQFYYDIDECYYTEWDEVDEEAWYEAKNEDGINPRLVVAGF
jgi:hypothetical protein